MGDMLDNAERDALHSQLLATAATILSAAKESGVVPSGCCLLVSIGNLDSAVVLADGNPVAAEKILQHIETHAQQLVSAIHRKTGN